MFHVTTVALITDIFQKYLEKNRCPYVTDAEEQSTLTYELLSQVIVVGGFCRDILMNHPINNIDIIINLRELCKLQTEHLEKYHSTPKSQHTSCRCVCWQHYLQKLTM